MSHPTKLVKTFVFKGNTLLELAEKTEEYLLKHPECIVLTRYTKRVVEKQVFDRYYRHQATGHEKRVIWYVKLGVVE